MRHIICMTRYDSKKFHSYCSKYIIGKHTINKTKSQGWKGMTNSENKAKDTRVGIVLLKFLITSYLITGVLLLFLAFLLYKLRLSDSLVSAGIILVYILSTFLTGMLAGKTIGRKKYLWGLCLGGLYFLVLFLVSFLYKRNMHEIAQNLPFTMLLCLASGMLGGMLS